jgi:hypothetical protein
MTSPGKSERVKHLDAAFERAAISTSLLIFNEELATRFSRWKAIPCHTLQHQIKIWERMGARAAIAHEQGIVKYNLEIGLIEALTERQRTMEDFSAFEESRNMYMEERRKSLSGDREILAMRSKNAKSKLRLRVKEILANHPEMPLRELEPFFRPPRGGVLYLVLLERSDDVVAHIPFCRSETPAPMNHNGLHGALCFDKGPDSQEAAAIIVAEILRNIDVLTRMLVADKGNQ